MRVAFNLTADKAELKALLNFSSEHINAFSQSSVDLPARMIEEERAEFANRCPDRQYEAAMGILSGSVRYPQKARHGLGCRLDQAHQAMIIWSREPEVKAGALEALADRVELAASGARPLRIRAKASATWLWLSNPVSVETLNSIEHDGFEIAVGRVVNGFSGFTQSHESALITQQVMLKTRRQDRIVSYDQIKLAHLMLRQGDFSHMASETLGQLFHAPDDIREGLRVYLNEGSNAAQAAKTIGLHRSTMNRRLERANDLLPEPLNSHNRIQIGAVLDALYWA